MTLGADIDAALPYFRAQAESRMSETVTVFRTELVDEGIEPTEQRVTLYSGKARLKFSSSVASDRTSGSQFVVSQSAELHLPSGTSWVGKDPTVEVTASSSDQSLVGRQWTVKGRPQAGQTTAARYALEEV